MSDRTSGSLFSKAFHTFYRAMVDSPKNAALPVALVELYDHCHNYAGKIGKLHNTGNRKATTKNCSKTLKIQIVIILPWVALW